MADPSLLIVRFSAIGDCVMTAWAATAFRNRYPEGYLCWAVESRCAAVVDQNALVNELAEFPRDRWKKARWSPSTWREQLAYYTRLRRHQFDFGIDFQGHSKTALCLRLAAPAKRVSARATDEFAKHLNPTIAPPAVTTHVVDWNHRVLREFDDFEFPGRPVMPLQRHLDRSLVTISVSAGQPEKAWNAEGWKMVALDLMHQGFHVAFLGGPTDAGIRLEGADDLVGKLTLEETQQWVANSALHVAADTGTGHMAAAYGVPVVSIFGPTDPVQYRPYTQNGIVLREGTKTENVTPSQVVEAAGRVLATVLN